MKRALLIAGVVWLGMLRRKDVYVFGILALVLLLWMLSMDFFGVRGVSRYVLDSGLLLTWAFSWILVVTLSARQLPDEERSGTIYTLLAKPLSRSELVTGKWLGAWTAATAATAAFFSVVALIVTARGQPVSAAAALQALGLHVALLGIVSALAIALSTRLNADAAVTLTMVVSLAGYALAPGIPRLLLELPEPGHTILGALYYALPHLELFDLRKRLVHDWGPADGGVFLATLLYGLCWSAFLLLAAWLSYRGKRFQRDLQ